ncbi:ribose-5-phosphate isomerase RpiA [Candidatus Endowatersipora endosymbiont of Watersipora subatra]|uniref:ribose-5-phosphate isomerase RpiA n=1 Tax=Candidatus Endowatersipora endosymbiont of Watersipora subatra TaxID=3077946 RepID=UPI00312C6E4F
MFDTKKIRAGEAALRFIESGMRVGIGSGSTAEAFIHVLNKKIAKGFQIIGVPTSLRTQKLCQVLNIPITDLDKIPELDVTIDGADEIDPALNLIKGGGGALLREKIVAYASRTMIVIADETKMVDKLGRFPLPIEVNLFGLKATQIAIKKLADCLGLSAKYTLRKNSDSTVFITDSGHNIIDVSFSNISDFKTLTEQLPQIPGVVEHGLFIGIASRAIVATNSGIDIIKPNSSL